jgi:hypothetical protein
LFRNRNSVVIDFISRQHKFHTGNEHNYKPILENVRYKTFVLSLSKCNPTRNISVLQECLFLFVVTRRTIKYLFLPASQKRWEKIFEHFLMPKKPSLQPKFFFFSLNFSESTGQEEIQNRNFIFLFSVSF